MIVMRNFGKNCEKFGSVKECSHMSVKMCRVDPYRDSMFDLRPDFVFRFFGLDMGRGCGRFRPKIARRIEQTRNFIFGFYRTPSIGFPFAGEGEVQAQVGVRVVYSVGSDFGEPCAGHHDAGGSNRILVERVKAGGVRGMGLSKIVSMNDEEFRSGRIAQALSDGFILAARVSRG